MTTRRWVDWVNIILGVWLIVSPWSLIEVARVEPAAWSSWSAGIGIVTLACLAMRRPTVWGDAMGILLGTWVIASPWVLGFASASASVTNAVIIGALVIAYALWAARIDITSGAGDEYHAHRARPV